MAWTHMDRCKYYFLAIGMLLLLFLLAACGTNTGTATASNGLTATPTVSNGLTATPTVPLQPQSTQKCGTVHTINEHVVSSDQNRVKGIEDCFLQAYRQCQSATLLYAQGSLDTSKLHTFSLTNQNNKCLITDTLQLIVLPQASRPGGSYTCSGLEQQADGLHILACGNEGPVLVPIA